MQDVSVKHKVQVSAEEHDLGVLVVDNLKLSTQCIKAAAKARSVLGLVKRNFRKLDVTDFLILFKTYIRPHVEYCKLGLLTYRKISRYWRKSSKQQQRLYLV